MAFKVLGKVIKKDTIKPEPESYFDEKELNFILTKLRTASYTGNEFETFYAIWLKLLELGPKNLK